MGPIKIAGVTIAKEGENVENVILEDSDMGKVEVTVKDHEAGLRAHITVKSEFSSETRIPPPGKSAMTNGVLVSHERE